MYYFLFILFVALVTERILKKKLTAKRLDIFRISAAGFIVITCGIYFVIWLRTEANPYWNAEHSRMRIEKNIDPAMLQAWATNLLRQYPPSETNYVNYGGRVPLPDGLSSVWKHGGPHVIVRNGSQGEEPYVCLGWGSAMLGSWGLAIGSPTFVLRSGMESGNPQTCRPDCGSQGFISTSIIIKKPFIRRSQRWMALSVPLPGSRVLTRAPELSTLDQHAPFDSTSNATGY